MISASQISGIGGTFLCDYFISNYPEKKWITNVIITELAALGGDPTSQKLYLDERGQLKLQSDYKVSIAEGGVYNSANWSIDNPYLSAKQNLHIRYGTGAPATVYDTPVEGDIYLKIIE